MDKNIVESFCRHCDWTYQVWILRKVLYDDNPHEYLLRHPIHAFFFTRLEKILQEYWIHEVTKLHDPASQHGFDNLSIDYIYECGDWSPEIRDKLNKLKVEMNRFYTQLKPARNKLLSHKDKQTILSEITLGSFEEGDDEKYFEALKDYASEVYMSVVGEPFSFDELTRNDVDVFMTTFLRGHNMGSTES